MIRDQQSYIHSEKLLYEKDLCTCNTMITQKKYQTIRVTTDTHDQMTKLCPKNKSYGSFVAYLIAKVYGDGKTK